MMASVDTQMMTPLIMDRNVKGTTISMVLRSSANRLRILPVGVPSKKLTGALISFCITDICMVIEALMPPTDMLKKLQISSTPIDKKHVK